MFIIKKQLLIGLFLVPLFSYGQEAFLSVCDRTPHVRDLIMEKVTQIDSSIECHDDDLIPLILTEIKELSFSRPLPLGLFFRGMTSLKAGDFSGLPNLYKISIQSHRIPSLPQGLFSNLPNLEHLHLSYNEISSLPQDIFSNLPKLKYLNLSGNHINSLHEDAFLGTSNLEYLNLSYNLMTSLPNSIISGDMFSETYISRLYIRDNPLDKKTTRRLVMNLKKLSDNKHLKVVH